MRIYFTAILLFSMLIAHAQKRDTIPVYIIVVDIKNNKNAKQLRNNTFTIKGNLIGDKVYDKCLKPLPKEWEALQVIQIREKVRCDKPSDTQQR